jgi:DAACS family dicarboxylate/amino acid:cation (Na+ or H+) symporter
LHQASKKGDETGSMSQRATAQSENATRTGPSAARVLGALVAGAAAGVAVNLAAGGEARLETFIRYTTEPLGQLWLRSLIMIVVPLVFATLTLGVVGLGDLRHLGRVGAKTIACFLGVTMIAVLVGLTLVNAVRPGDGLPPETRDRLLATYSQQAKESRTLAGQSSLGVHTLVNIVPRNPVAAAAQGDMLGVIFFSLIFGVALAGIQSARTLALTGALTGLADVVLEIIRLVMKVAPYGVFCLIFTVAARFGFGLLRPLGWYIVTVLTGLIIVQFVLYPLLVLLLGRRNPREFLRAIWPVMVTAFSTSSSNATLPVSLRISETALRIPPGIAGFVLPLGATMNMNGTALFEGVSVLFIAQVFGMDLSLPAQGVVVAMAVLTAIGTAGVPGGSIPLLVLVLEAVGVPGEGIAIIIGVDRLLDMSRTVVNVSGDLTAAVLVDRSERS